MSVKSRSAALVAGLDALAAQAKKGIVCVRSTRVVTGRVGRERGSGDDELTLVASDDLEPPRRLAFCSGWRCSSRAAWADVQRLLVEY